MNDSLTNFRDGGFSEVRGYLNKTIFNALQAVQTVQEKLEVKGPMAEIGVHRGQFFLALENLKSDANKSIAVDVFEMQEFNIDKSGRGILEEFSENVAANASYPESVVKIEADSTQLSAEDLLRETKNLKFRLFSIDGGHTSEHTVHDLRIAQRCLANYGVVFVDDYYHPSWPGVHEGFARFMIMDTPAIVPFAYDCGKLLLTTFSTHRRVLEEYVAAREGLDPDVRTLETYMYGHKVIRFQ